MISESEWNLFDQMLL